jgi:hypothetical protein
VWNSYTLFGDAVKELIAWAVVGVATAAIAYVVARIPRARQWFTDRHLAIPLAAAFLVSGVMAGTMALILRHQTKQDLASMGQQLSSFKEDLSSVKSNFSLITGGQVTADGKLDLNHQYGPFTFIVTKQQAGRYLVMLKERQPPHKTSPLPDIPIILVGSLSGETWVSAKVVNTRNVSFVVQTFRHDAPADEDFWFFVFTSSYSS